MYIFNNSALHDSFEEPTSVSVLHHFWGRGGSGESTFYSGQYGENLPERGPFWGCSNSGQYEENLPERGPLGLKYSKDPLKRNSKLRTSRLKFGQESTYYIRANSAKGRFLDES